MKQRKDGRWERVVTVNGKRKTFYSDADTETKAEKDIRRQIFDYKEKAENKLKPLIGKEGVALTECRPVGKILIDGVSLRDLDKKSYRNLIGEVKSSDFKSIKAPKN